MVLDFAKEALANASPRTCFRCKKVIPNAVCNSFVVHIVEEGELYECINCLKTKEIEDYEKEKYAREILERILKEIGKRGE